MSQSITFRGIKRTYISEGQLKKKLNLTTAQTKQLLKDYEKGNTTRFYADGANVGKYDLRDKPLFIQKFGIKKISNKEMIGAKSPKQIKTFRKFPINRRMRVTLDITVRLRFSDDFELRNFPAEVTETSETLGSRAFYKELVRDYYMPLEDEDIIIDNVNIVSQFSGQSFSITDMELRLGNPICIGQLYNEVIPNKNGNCVFDYLHKIYPRLSKKKKMKLKTTEDLYNYAKENNIKMVAYDISGKVIKSFYPETKAKLKNLIFIAYNNHLYPLKNQVLNKVVKPVDYETYFVKDEATADCGSEYIDPLEKKLVEFLEEGIMPAWVGFFNNKVSSFFVDNINYIYNPDYPTCEMVLSEMGLRDHLKPSTRIGQLGSIIEKLYLKSNINSFMPNAKDFNRGGFNFGLDFEIDDAANFIGLDKNQHYTYSLMKLPYLIKCNYLTAKRRTKDIERIVAHYLYTIEIEESNILTMNNNLYTGEQLIYYQNVGIPYTIIEEIETEKTENYFKKMIMDLNEKFDKDIVKQIMVILIGKMEQHRQKIENNKFVKICSKDEADCFEGFKREITLKNKKWWVKDSDKLYICSEPTRPTFELECRMPIAIQVKDYSRIVIYEMCEELGLNQGDILGIKTDCIYLHKKYQNLFQRYLGKGIGDWKTQEYKKIKPNTPLKRIVRAQPKNQFCNYLAYQYAGGGKTWTIINEVIPKLKKDYIVLSPSHASLMEYRLGGYNCCVIQTYIIQARIPKEKIIIVDEVGMLDKQSIELLLKCSLLGKTIMAFGDFKQLLPVKGSGENSSNLWLKYFFHTIDYTWINRRNGFSKEYYDSIIYGKKAYVKKEVVRHSKETPYDAEVIIVHTNKTRIRYNKFMAMRNAIKDMTDIGARIMCKTNDLKHLGIYNNYDFKVIDNEGDIILGHEKLGAIKIDKKDIQDNFEFSYARTIYNLQGATIDSYFFAPEDYEYIDGRMAYTIISRLKGASAGNREEGDYSKLKKYIKFFNL